MAAIYDEKDRNRRFSPARQRLTLPPAGGAKSGVPLAKGKLLKEAGLSNGASVHLKDLGQQVRSSQSTVCRSLYAAVCRSLVCVFYGKHAAPPPCLWWHFDRLGHGIQLAWPRHFDRLGHGISTGLASSDEVEQDSTTDAKQESNTDSHNARSKAQATVSCVLQQRQGMACLVCPYSRDAAPRPAQPTRKGAAEEIPKLPLFCVLVTVLQRDNDSCTGSVSLVSSDNTAAQQHSNIAARQHRRRAVLFAAHKTHVHSSLRPTAALCLVHATALCTPPCRYMPSQVR